MKRRKLLTYLLLFTMTISMTACGKDTEPSTAEVTTTGNTATEAPATAAPIAEKSLYEHGLEIITLMDEMLHSELYLHTMTSSGEIQEAAATLAQETYDTPTAVYEITVPTFASMLALLEEEITGMNALSEDLITMLNARSASSLISQLNAREGTTALATVSVFTANKVFVSEELTENTIYLYTFENGTPIAVVFTLGEDHAVSAAGYFVLSSTLPTESADELQTALKELFVYVKELEIN